LFAVAANFAGSLWDDCLNDPLHLGSNVFDRAFKTVDHMPFLRPRGRRFTARRWPLPLSRWGCGNECAGQQTLVVKVPSSLPASALRIAGKTKAGSNDSA